MVNDYTWNVGACETCTGSGVTCIDCLNDESCDCDEREECLCPDCHGTGQRETENEEEED